MSNTVLNIILDIDGCEADFVTSFEEFFSVNIIELSEIEVTERVESLKRNTKFWTSLKKLNDLDFTPRAYCTARINSKYSTKKWLRLNDLPLSPVYQVKGYKLSKVPQLKRIPTTSEYKVFIDDSWKNVQDALDAGIPALLYDTPFNQSIETKLRIKSLDLKTICHAFRRNYI